MASMPLVVDEIEDVPCQSEAGFGRSPATESTSSSTHGQFGGPHGGPYCSFGATQEVEVATMPEESSRTSVETRYMGYSA